ncbi:MAG: orc1/cdc6 family replication initiation protein [Candidatus Aenigmarchaeota archaeon]|nr:orc1/cdc6 family replication initiation protein [Candidatus Aenigmarchaeota archaeon]
MQSKKTEILIDPDVLSESHLSNDIHSRESHVNEIINCMRPITNGDKPVNCWLYGKSGAGKTASAIHALRKLTEEAGVRGVYVNCWEYPTFFSVLERTAMKLRMLGAEKLSTSFKLERLKRHISGERLVIVLDEIDKPPPKERHAILYNLSGLSKTGLICACNSQHAYFDLEDRIKSRLNPARIHFQEYTQNELFEILLQRARHALATDTCDEGLFHTIAALASGDARIAIHTLKNAAFLAEKDAQDVITNSHVMKAWNSANDLNKTHMVSKLTDHHRLLYELISKNNRILSGELWRQYIETCDSRKIRPIAVRTYSDYCNKLVEFGLVQAKRAAIQGKVREFTVAQ